MNVMTQPVREKPTVSRKSASRRLGNVKRQGQRRFVLRVVIDLDQRADSSSDATYMMIRD